MCAVAVMLGEIVLAGARPGASKIMSVIVLTVGIGIFMLFKPSKKAATGDSFEWNLDMAVGCGLVMLALVMDGVYGPYQNKITKEAEKATGEKLSPYHLMFNMNFYQGVFSLLMVSLQLLSALSRLAISSAILPIARPSEISDLGGYWVPGWYRAARSLSRD